jgi:hypothetical protein
VAEPPTNALRTSPARRIFFIGLELLLIGPRNGFP